MKSGTGDDPFADEEELDDDTQEEPAASSDDPQPSSTAATEESAEQSTAPANNRSPEENTESIPDTNSTANSSVNTADIPWVLRRDGVKDERPNMTQFFLQDSTDQAEREFQRDVENILDKDVYLLDLREAAYQVAMEHPEEVASILQEWGYDYL